MLTTRFSQAAKRLRKRRYQPDNDPVLRLSRSAMRSVARDLRAAFANLGDMVPHDKVLAQLRQGKHPQSEISWNHYKEVFKGVFARIGKLREAGAELGAGQINRAFARSGRKVRYRKADNYNPDEPRDEHGRWTTGGAAPGHAFDVPPGVMTPQRALEIAGQVSDRLGFDKSAISATTEDRTFKLGGRDYYYAGSAVISGPGAGKITLYTRQLNERTTPAVVAHEIEHQRYQSFLNQYDRERAAATAAGEHSESRDYEGKLRYPAYAAQTEADRNQAKMIRDDGVTDYSKTWWKAYHNNEANLRQAQHETLAEMAAVAYDNKGKIPGSREWKDYYRAVKAHYKGTGSFKKQIARIDGEAALAVYLDDSFNLVDKDKATLVKVLYENGAQLFLVPAVKKDAPLAYDKATKAQAGYRHGTPASHCGICKMFIPIASCTAVYGAIAPDDTCDFFESARVSKAADDFTFDSFSPEVQDAVRRAQDVFIQELEANARDAIDTIISDGTRYGTPLDEIADNIKEMIGLTDTQAQAVLNYQNMLQQLDPQALQRALRNKEYDASLQDAIDAGEDLSDAAIERMVADYIDNYLDYRSATIAQTESTRAASLGLHDAYSQAIDRGALTDDAVTRQWLLGDNPCPICESIADNNEDGVGVDEDFDSDDGPISDPPVHPSCECSVDYVTDLSKVPE